MIEITTYFHGRPESSFSSVEAAAGYLFPDDPAGFKNACDELRSFHETANRARHLKAKRTDRYAYLPETETGLREWYEGQVGYDPMSDDPSMTVEQLRELCASYQEARQCN